MGAILLALRIYSHPLAGVLQGMAGDSQDAACTISPVAAQCLFIGDGDFMDRHRFASRSICGRDAQRTHDRALAAHVSCASAGPAFKPHRSSAARFAALDAEACGWSSDP